MAPQQTPTTITTTLSETFSTVAPLTTIWTPPASCASQIPTIAFGGTCYSTDCTAYDAAQFSSIDWYGWLSFAYYTLGGVQVSTACAPPSTQAGPLFWYSPAVGCPKGYISASSSFYSYGSETSLVCCPS